MASDISKSLKDDFSLVQHDSVVKRIRRFFKYKLFNPYFFYDKIIRFVIRNYKKKHIDKKVHIIFDHMFSKDNYTVFMISMRVGKQGISLWFRCFLGKDSPDAFKKDLLKEGISYVSELFSNDDFELIFLADRWFNSISLMQHIASLGHTFNIRIKRNVKLLIYGKKEKHNIWKWFYDLFAYEYHSNYLFNIPITDKRYPVNIAISKKQDVEEPWIIVTNGNPNRAIRDYGYRYGGIETIFKNQKSDVIKMLKLLIIKMKKMESQYVFYLFLTLGLPYSKEHLILLLTLEFLFA